MGTSNNIHVSNLKCHHYLMYCFCVRLLLLPHEFLLILFYYFFPLLVVIGCGQI